MSFTGLWIPTEPLNLLLSSKMETGMIADLEGRI
jgi:hypothetical protein